MIDELMIGAWNVRGFGNPHRAQIARNWVRRSYPKLQILCPQELQANEVVVKLHLQNLFPNSTIQMDCTQEGRVGSSIVVQSGIQVTAQGKKGDGTFSWVEITTLKGVLKIGSIYASAQRAKRISYWKWIPNFVKEDNWMLLGDYNMVEFPDDAIGPTTVIHGAEGRSWHQLVDQSDLLDLYLCASQRKGPLYMRQAKSGSRQDSSRLDCCYGSNRGEWFQVVRQIDHDGRETLSDHAPIVIQFEFSPPDSGRLKKGTYFKFDGTYLQDPDFKELAARAWGAPDEGCAAHFFAQSG
jgi:exonuclease III